MLFSFHLGHLQLQLHAYGAAMVLGFSAGIALASRAAERLDEDVGRMRDLCFWLLVSAMVGARLLFIITQVPAYAAACAEARDGGPIARTLWECTRALHVWEGGLVFYGGLLGAIGFAAYYTRRRGMDFWRTADAVAPAIALGHFFGRLGCYASGCCWGAPSTAPWAVRFPPESLAFQELVLRGALSPLDQLTAPVHPVQLYEAAGLLGIFALLTALGRRKRYDGQVLAAYLAAYAILRAVVELYRGDLARRLLLPALSTSQLIAVLTLAAAAALAVWRRRASRRAVTLERTGAG